MVDWGDIQTGRASELPLIFPHYITKEKCIIKALISWTIWAKLSGDNWQPNTEKSWHFSVFGSYFSPKTCPKCRCVLQEGSAFIIHFFLNTLLSSGTNLALECCIKDVPRYRLNEIGNTLIFFLFFFFFQKSVEQFYELIEKYSTYKLLFMLEYNKKNAGFSSDK